MATSNRNAGATQRYAQRCINGLNKGIFMFCSTSGTSKTSVKEMKNYKGSIKEIQVL